jgi:hypothetical protein
LLIDSLVHFLIFFGDSIPSSMTQFFAVKNYQPKNALLSLLVLLFCLTPQPVFAHTKSTSYSTWEIDQNQVRITIRVPLIEVQRALPFFAAPSDQILPEN